MRPAGPLRTMEDFARSPQQAMWMDEFSLAALAKHNLPALEASRELQLMRDLDARRAQFNTLQAPYEDNLDPADLSAGLSHLGEALDLFNHILPYRATLVDNPEKRAAHDLLISRVANDPQIRYTFVDRDRRAYEADPSTRYVYAAILMDLMHNRWDDLVRPKIVEGHPPLHIVFMRNFTDYPIMGEVGRYTGIYTGTGEDIHMDPDLSFWWPIGRGQTPSIVAHEVTHGLKSVRVPVVGLSYDDGQMIGMAEADRAIVKREYERLKEELLMVVAEANNESFEKLRREYLRDELTDRELRRFRELFEKFKRDEVYSIYGIRKYAFTAEDMEHIFLGRDALREFMNVITELYQVRPQVVKDASPELYDVLRRYFRVDPLDGWRDLSPEEAARR